jgi:hypothetical protein
MGKLNENLEVFLVLQDKEDKKVTLRKRLELALAEQTLEDMSQDEILMLARDRLVKKYSKLNASKMLSLIENYAPNLLSMLDE